MYQVMIVDDEVHAVRGLQAGVDWEKLNIPVIQTAHSMRQAQEIFQSGMVDLMICDIEMPQGSGIELAEWVQTNYPQTVTIFLTCHSDFSYAKRAIQLDSFEYLLKPVDYEELEDVIRRAIAKISKEERIRTFEETYNHYHPLWSAHKPMMKERFWLDLIGQAIPSAPDKIAEHLAKYDLSPIRAMRFIPILIRIDLWHKKLTPREEKIMEYALRNAAEEEIARHDPNSVVIPYNAGILLALLAHDGKLQQNELRTNCDKYIQACNQYFFCDLCCCIGEPVPLHEMVGMVDKLMNRDRNNVTIRNAALFLRDESKEVARIELPDMKAWAEWMKQGARDKLTGEAERFFGRLRDAGEAVSAHVLHDFYQDLLQMLFYVLQMKGLQANKVFAAHLLTEKPEAVLRSLRALEEWVHYVIGVAMDQIHTAEGNLSIVDRVRQFVAANISEAGLSREDIAGYVYLNPDYLTRVFKKETGLSISDYLQQQRIEYAKDLLETTDKSVSEIALLAGYSNLSYFSTIFKKTVRLNPNEYRKQVRK